MKRIIRYGNRRDVGHHEEDIIEKEGKDGSRGKKCEGKKKSEIRQRIPID